MSSSDGEIAAHKMSLRGLATSWIQVRQLAGQGAGNNGDERRPRFVARVWAYFTQTEGERSAGCGAPAKRKKDEKRKERKKGKKKQKTKKRIKRERKKN